MTNETLVLRQVHPSFIQAGRVTSQVFRPTPKDLGRLSGYDGDQIDAEKAFAHYTTELEFESAGVLAVTVAECKEIELTVEPDPKPFPEHVVIVFHGLTDNQSEKKSKKLNARAATRGWLYQPPASD